MCAHVRAQVFVFPRNYWTDKTVDKMCLMRRIITIPNNPGIKLKFALGLLRIMSR